MTRDCSGFSPIKDFEGPRAAIAALGDMVRMTWDDDAGEASHAAS